MKLYFEDTGADAPALVLVAGLASDSISWILQRDEFAKHFRLLTPDNRGVARSPIPKEPYTVKEMADDLVEMLDSVNVDRAHFVGHSLGGAVVQQVALDHPERVERAVLACSFSHVEGRAIHVLESWTDGLRRGAGPEDLARLLFPWLYTERFFGTDGAFEAAVEAFAQHPYPLTYEGVAGQLAALKGFDSRSRLNSLRAPTLCLAAEDDLLVPPDSCRLLAEALPHGTFQQLPATGHSCLLETPSLFNQAVLDFLLPN